MKPHAKKAFLVAATMVLASCAAGSAPPSEPGDDAVLLRLALPAGSEAVYEKVDTFSLAGSMGHATVVETSVKRVTVSEASGHLRLVKIVHESRSREQIDVTLPSSSVEALGNVRDRALGSGLIVVADVLGRVYESVQLEDGVELSLDSVRTEPLTDGGSPLGIKLPERPVRIGDSWRPSEAKVEPEAEAGFDGQLKTEYRLDSVRVVDGARHAFISSENEAMQTISQDMPGVGAVEIRSEGTGSEALELDLESGFLVSESSLFEGTTTAYTADGQSIPLTMTQRVSSRTTLVTSSQQLP